MDENIGFVGVGAMGSRMAANLLDVGYDVVAYDIDEDRLGEMCAAGAESAPSAAATAQEADVVMSSLPTTDAIQDAYCGPEGVFEGVREGALLVELSTARPAAAEQLHATARKRGLVVDIVDAPVIGVPPVAADAGLTVVVGGARAAYERAEPVLSHLADTVFHVGEPGTGYTTKLLNNVVLLGQYAIAAEAFALAGRIGLSRETLIDVIDSGMGGSEIIATKVGKALEEDFDASDGSPVDTTRKDLKYALDLGYDADFTMAITAAIEERYTLASTAGDGEKDYSVLMRVLDELGG